MNMKSLLSTKDLNKVKLNLPLNGMELIANKMDLSVSTISRVLNGKVKKNQAKVVQIALEIIDSEKESQSQLNKRIESL